ncbi:MAG TPA: aminotransferase class V-fold PLP-dependent enzyme [Ktedonobacteraceae bacterium]
MPELTHLERIRQQMPATTSHIYLNTGTFGPLPDCVALAMQERIQVDWQNGRLGAAAFEAIGTIYGNARSSVARLLNADADEITLTDNTGEGMNIISYGIQWHEGDEVITTNHEHISLLAPLYQLRDRYGIVIRIADIGPTAERPVLKAIADLVTPRTRLISISHVTWTTGAVLNISEVAYMGREWGIPVLIDGAQSAGAIPADVKALGVDFYAIPMQKWLCGPDGTGALYVRKDALRYVSPTYVGYWSIKHEEGLEWELLESAQRFEVGGRQTAAIAGQAAVLNWLEETVGHQWLFERIASLSAYAYKAFKEVPGLTMLTPQPGVSGLVAFKLEERDDAETVTYLRDKHNMYIRNIPSTKSLRISTGFYNTEEEIDKLVAALQEM